MTAEYDEGPVLAQRRVPVEASDDVTSLRTRVQEAEKDLLVDWLSEYCGQAPHMVPGDSRHTAAVTAQTPPD